MRLRQSVNAPARVAFFFFLFFFVGHKYALAAGSPVVTPAHSFALAAVVGLVEHVAQDRERGIPYLSRDPIWLARCLQAEKSSRLLIQDVASRGIQGESSCPQVAIRRILNSLQTVLRFSIPPEESAPIVKIEPARNFSVPTACSLVVQDLALLVVLAALREGARFIRVEIELEAEIEAIRLSVQSDEAGVAANLNIPERTFFDVVLRQASAEMRVSPLGCAWFLEITVPLAAYEASTH
jgi:hypothetical protein